MNRITLLVGAAALCGGLTATAATAMPIAPVPANSAANIEQVRLVCNAYGRCWWRPNYYGGYRAYGYYPRHRYWRHHHHHRHYYY
jgi:hypothetical protein